MLKPGTNYCLCAACGEYFNSVRAFERHRHGKATDRQCLTIEQMEQIGMSVNASGYWITKRMQMRPAYRHD